MSLMNLRKRNWLESTQEARATTANMITNANAMKNEKIDFSIDDSLSESISASSEREQQKTKETKSNQRVEAMERSAALLREPVDVERPVFLDAKTGLAVRMHETYVSLFEAPQFNGSNVPAVLYALVDGLDEAKAKQAATLSDAALAQFAAAVLMYVARYDYYAGEWLVRPPREAGDGEQEEFCDPQGVYVRDTLLADAVVERLLASQENTNEPEEHRALLRATAERLQSSERWRRRIVRRMEPLMLWHAPPSIGAAAAAVGQRHKWLVVEWLVRVFGRKLVRRSSAVCADAAVPSRPALVSDMWADFCGFCGDETNVGIGAGSIGIDIDKRQFGLLVADWLGEWPRRHARCRKLHLVGFQWRGAEVSCWQKTPANVSAAFDIVDAANAAVAIDPIASAAATTALEAYRRHMLAHFDH